MKSIGLIATVLSLVFLAACGGGGPANPGVSGAGFSNASLNGRYVFTMNGQCVSVCASSTPIESVGEMTADGNGNITAGTWDVNSNGADQTLSVSGTYSVSSNGTANVTLNDSANSYSFGVTLTNVSSGYIVSADGAWTLSGTLAKQDPTAFSTAPAGTFVFRASGVTSGSGSLALAGAMNFGTGALVADMNNNGTPISLGTANITSTYDTTKGRGVLNLTTTGGLPSNMGFVFYLVDSNTIELVSNDATNCMQGRGEASSGAVGGGSVLQGTYAFLASGFPPSGEIQVTEGGLLTGPGGGGATSGVIDTVFDSQVPEIGSGLSATGVLSTQNGVTRDALTLSATSSGFSMTSPVLWMTNSGRGFFVTLDSDRAEAGTVNIQSGSPFTDSGTYGFGQNGWATSAFTGSGDEAIGSATLFTNNAGDVPAYSQLLNVFGSSVTGTGTGNVAFNGAGTIGTLTLNNSPLGGTETFRFYQYSASNAFIMEVDQSTVTAGTMTVQTHQ